MKKFFLITNTSGRTYWSYLGTQTNTYGLYAEAVAKYGNIYINRHGGWFDEAAVKTVHETVTQEKFPVEAEQ